MRPTIKNRQFAGNAIHRWGGWVMPVQINRGPGFPALFEHPSFEHPPRTWSFTDHARRFIQFPGIHRALRFLMAPNCKGGLR